jgi:predicted nuclease of restriction endonuclease-like (RecB) superfamily
MLLVVVNRQVRSLYEIEAARESWSGWEFGRKIEALLFACLAMSRDEDEVATLA